MTKAVLMMVVLAFGNTHHAPAIRVAFEDLLSAEACVAAAAAARQMSGPISMRSFRRGELVVKAQCVERGPAAAAEASQSERR